jgi:hypothetical protein
MIPLAVSRPAISCRQHFFLTEPQSRMHATSQFLMAHPSSRWIPRLPHRKLEHQTSFDFMLVKSLDLAMEKF